MARPLTRGLEKACLDGPAEGTEIVNYVFAEQV